MPPRTQSALTTPDELVEDGQDPYFEDEDPILRLPYEERMQLAIEAIQTGAYKSVRKAAVRYAVPRATLGTRIKGVATRVEANVLKRKLTVPQETILVEWIKSLGRRGVPLSLPVIGAYAAEIYGAKLGVTWPIRFKKRHPDLKIRLEECRARALSRPVVHNYFELLAETIERYDIKPKNIWNMDEKGIQLGVGDKTRVLVDRDQTVVKKIESGNRDLVTIIECISATGNAIHPSVIFEGKRRDLRWGEDNPCNASISISEKGWTDQELGALWLEKDFAPASSRFLDDPGDYRLLIFDGHNSHCTYRLISFAQKHRIVILCLPSHTTHALQPCDVGVFSPLSAKWKARVSEQHANHIMIDKYNLLSNYAFARDQALKKSTIINSFRRCGIEPLDEKAVPQHLFEPALNYTTQAAMPVPARLPALLVPVHASSASRTSTPPSDPSGPLRPTTPTNSVRSANDALQARDAVRAAYAIAMPSPVKKTASRRALAAENDQLRDLIKAAGIEIDQNYAQMVTTTEARLMTGEEMTAALLDDLQKRLLKAIHLEMKKTLFPAIRKAITDAEKAEEAAAKAAAKATTEAEKAAAKAAKAAERDVMKAAKAEAKAAKAAAKAKAKADREAAKIAKAAARARGRGGARGGRGRARAVGGRSRGRDEAEGSSDENESSAQSSDEEFGLDDRDDDSHAGTEVESSNEEEDRMLALVSLIHAESSAIHSETDDDNESDDEEIAIVSLNGHRWKARKDLEFQVVWADRDVTWEPVDLDDPLLLSRRKYLINMKLKASNE